MLNDETLHDYFESEDIELIHKTNKAHNHYKKLQRRIRLALFGFISITFLPIVFSRYRDFDLVIHSPVFVSIIFVLLGYTLFTIIRFNRHTDFQKIENQKAIKRHADWMDLASFLISLFAMFVILNTFLVSLTSVAMEHSDSMKPTLEPGDDLLVWHNNVTYERFDIVVAKRSEDVYYVKRIIGLPGDTVMYVDNNLYIKEKGASNFELYEEPYLALGSVTCEDTCEYILAEDEVLLLGDNRNQSTDSRNLGPFQLKALYGKVFYRIRPFNTAGKVG